MVRTLILEDSSEVADDVDNTEDQAVLGSHGHIRPVGVALNGGNGRGSGKELVHLGWASNLVTGGVDSEDEGEDDGEKRSGVCAFEHTLSEKSRSTA